MVEKLKIIGPGKKYRNFYDSDDHAVWASYDGKDIKIMHVYSIDGIPFTGFNQDESNGLWGALQSHCKGERGMLKDILKEELRIIITEEEHKFPVYDEHKISDYKFSSEDPLSVDGRQYKVFSDIGGNWFTLVSRAVSNGRKKEITSGHLDWINPCFEEFLKRNGVDIKQLARYTSGDNGKLHVPTVEDFEKDFNVTDDGIEYL